jgi:acyl carrier protein
MSEQEIIERVRKILIEVFELREEDLTPEATLYDQLGLDSLDSVDLVVALEKEFGFKIERATDEERISAMRQLQDIYAFIQFKLEKIECAS